MHDMHLPNFILNTTFKQGAGNSLITEINNVKIWEKCAPFALLIKWLILSGSKYLTVEIR